MVKSSARQGGEITSLKVDNTSLKVEIARQGGDILSLKGAITVLTDRLDAVIQPISARQIATDADNAAIDKIFPQCRKKPYCVRTCSNLLSLLSNPDSHKFIGPDAPKSFLVF
jgi:hypothetical protein